MLVVLDAFVASHPRLTGFVLVYTQGGTHTARFWAIPHDCMWIIVTFVCAGPYLTLSAIKVSTCGGHRKMLPFTRVAHIARLCTLSQHKGGIGVAHAVFRPPRAIRTSIMAHARTHFARHWTDT